jgi:hypothetical protein
MPISYVDEVVAKYLIKKGFLIRQGIWFQLEKEKTGKKVSGWTDIDILAVKPDEPPLIIQCKSFPGTGKSDFVAEQIRTWFFHAESFLKRSEYRNWAKEVRKIFVVDYSIKSLEDKLKEGGIEIWHYKDILAELLEILKKEIKTRQSQKGKAIIGREEDTLLRVLSDLIIKEILK